MGYFSLEALPGDGPGGPTRSTSVRNTPFNSIHSRMSILEENPALIRCSWPNLNRHGTAKGISAALNYPEGHASKLCFPLDTKPKPMPQSRTGLSWILPGLYNSHRII